MKLIKAYTSVSLVLRIAIGLVIGAILALIVPQASWIGMFGTIFVGALKAIAPVLVLVLVSSSLAQSREKLGSQFVTIVILYLLRYRLNVLSLAEDEARALGVDLRLLRTGMHLCRAWSRQSGRKPVQRKKAFSFA